MTLLLFVWTIEGVMQAVGLGTFLFVVVGLLICRWIDRPRRKP